MPGKSYIKVTSVIFIISAVIAIIIYPLAGLLFDYAVIETGESMGWVFVVICLLYTIAAVLQLIAGMKGIRGCDKKEAANDLKMWGIVMMVLALLAGVVQVAEAIINGTSIMAGAASVLFGLILPGLYVHGASLNAKA